MTITPSRRGFLQAATGLMGAGWARLKGLARFGNFAVSPAPGELKESRLFPAGLRDSEWNTFPARGYAQPVTGILYRTHGASYFSAYVDRPHPASGMPVGGIDTGGLYIEPTGAFGYSSIFNSYTPAGGPLNTPFLGVGVGGRTWVLTTGQTKNYAGNNRPSVGPNLMLMKSGMCESIDYWGHYPIADLEAKNDAPVQMSVRCWSPFIPGDVKTSNTPGAVFEVHLRNITATRQAGTVAVSFPGFADHHTKNELVNWPDLAVKPVMPPAQITRRAAPAGLSGVWVEDKAWGMSYVLATAEDRSVRAGGALGTDGVRWSQIESVLPDPGNPCEDGGSSVSAKFSVEAGQEAVVRFILAWYAPEWEGNGIPGSGGTRVITEAPGGSLVPSTTGKRFTHMYALRFADAGEVASYLAQNHEPLLKRIIAWQSVIYDDKTLPGWLADALINAFYYFAPCSMWAQAKPPIGDWCKPEDGLFALEEAPRSCPHVTTLSNWAVAGPTISFFFPELMVSCMRAFRAYQKENGDVPQMFGRWMDVATPMAYQYQEVMLGGCYMAPAYLHWKITGDDEFLKEFYPSTRKAMERSFNRRPDLGDAQIIAMPPVDPHTWNDSEWFEDRSMIGYVSHPGGFRMAAAEMLREWAQNMGDQDQVRQLDRMLTAGKEAMQKYLWRGDHYLVYNDTRTGKVLDAFFTPILNGQYFARYSGVPPVFPSENVDKILTGMEEKVCKISKLGMPPTYASPDGSAWTENGTGYLTGRYVYTNFQVIWIAITAMYEGRREFGLDLLHKNLELSYCMWGYLWDGTCACSAGGDTGEVNYGWDYWFNWSIWTAPAALRNQDVSALMKPGGLVRKVLDAGKPV